LALEQIDLRTATQRSDSKTALYAGFFSKAPDYGYLVPSYVPLIWLDNSRRNIRTFATGFGVGRLSGIQSLI
jgi:hypothetical protein